MTPGHTVFHVHSSGHGQVGIGRLKATGGGYGSFSMQPTGSTPWCSTDAATSSQQLMLLLLFARLINHQDVVFDE